MHGKKSCVSLSPESPDYIVWPLRCHLQIRRIRKVEHPYSAGFNHLPGLITLASLFTNTSVTTNWETRPPTTQRYNLLARSPSSDYIVWLVLSPLRSHSQIRHIPKVDTSRPRYQRPINRCCHITNCFYSAYWNDNKFHWKLITKPICLNYKNN